MIELADTSAWTARHRNPHIEAEFNLRLGDGLIGTCRQVVLELLMGTRDEQEFARRRIDLDSLRDYPIRRREWDRAADVLHMLAERGPLHHRQVKLADLLIAAAAESAELPLVHYDRHFDLVAEVTGQPVRALAPLGSL